MSILSSNQKTFWGWARSCLLDIQHVGFHILSYNRITVLRNLSDFFPATCSFSCFHGYQTARICKFGLFCNMAILTFEKLQLVLLTTLCWTWTWKNPYFDETSLVEAHLSLCVCIFLKLFQLEYFFLSTSKASFQHLCERKLSFRSVRVQLAHWEQQCNSAPPTLCSGPCQTTWGYYEGLSSSLLCLPSKYSCCW